VCGLLEVYQKFLGSCCLHDYAFVIMQRVTSTPVLIFNALSKQISCVCASLIAENSTIMLLSIVISSSFQVNICIPCNFDINFPSSQDKISLFVLCSHSEFLTNYRAATRYNFIVSS
jgi:formyltetrahydrofolate synthetase